MDLLNNGDKKKPWISLSGDDDGNHYVLYPRTEDKQDWSYDVHLIIETGKAVQPKRCSIVQLKVP